MMQEGFLANLSIGICNKVLGEPSDGVVQRALEEVRRKNGDKADEDSGPVVYVAEIKEGTFAVVRTPKTPWFVAPLPMPKCNVRGYTYPECKTTAEVLRLVRNMEAVFR